MMRKWLFPLSVLLLYVVLYGPATAAEPQNAKVKSCLKSKECAFIVSGAATDDPKMSFLVHDKVWKTFGYLDKEDLRRILRYKIEEANEKPGKYIHVSKKAPSYDAMERNIKNMRSYSVFVSYGKNRKGDLQLDEETMINW